MLQLSPALHGPPAVHARLRRHPKSLRIVTPPNWVGNCPQSSARLAPAPGICRMSRFGRGGVLAPPGRETWQPASRSTNQEESGSGRPLAAAGVARGYQRAEELFGGAGAGADAGARAVAAVG